MREQAKSLPRTRESPQSFALSIPAPALLTQVDEHSLELYVVTPDGIPVTQRVHAAVVVWFSRRLADAKCGRLKNRTRSSSQKFSRYNSSL